MGVPSNFSKHVFQSAGVTKPIHVIREGFDPALFLTIPTETALFRYRKHFYPSCRLSDTIFLSVGKVESRKGFDILIKTFVDTFKEYDLSGRGACLYLRTDLTTLKMPQEKNIRIFGLERLTNEDLVLAYQR